MLAAPRTVSYLAAALVAACGAPVAPVVPVGAYSPVGADAFRALAARTAPAAPVAMYFRWRYDDGSAPVTGRGAVRLAPPDSLRLDVGVPVVGRATLVLAGDSTWAQPQEVADHVLAERALVWAMFGVIRPPDRATRIEVGEAADRTVYRLTAPDGVVTMLEVRGDTMLAATRRLGEAVIGRIVLTRNAAGVLARASAVDVRHHVRFQADLDRWEAASAPFPSEIWRRP